MLVVGEQVPRGEPPAAPGWVAVLLVAVQGWWSEGDLLVPDCDALSCTCAVSGQRTLDTFEVCAKVLSHCRPHLHSLD